MNFKKLQNNDDSGFKFQYDPSTQNLARRVRVVTCGARGRGFNPRYFQMLFTFAGFRLWEHSWKPADITLTVMLRQSGEGGWDLTMFQLEDDSAQLVKGKVSCAVWSRVRVEAFFAESTNRVELVKACIKPFNDVHLLQGRRWLLYHQSQLH